MIPETFRTALQAALVAAVPEIGGRALQPRMASAETAKPFLVHKLGTANSPETFALDSRLEIWLYAHTSYQSLTVIAVKVVAALHKQVIDGYELELVGIGDEFFDEAWQAVARRVDFNIPSLIG